MKQIDLTKYKPIPDYPRYSISEDGEIWDTQRNIVIPQTVNGGYKCTNLYRADGKKVLEKIHKLVYKTHVEDIPVGTKLQHKDRDKHNNHYTNICKKEKSLHVGKSVQKYQELSLYSVNHFKNEYEAARTVWYGMMSRCYDTDNNNYNFYGGRGVHVCDAWKDKDAFINWHSKLAIAGWALDKDFLYDGNLVYSPETCVFLPRGLNSLIAKTATPIVKRNSVGYNITTFVAGGHKIFYGDSEEDCLEQLSLVRKLQLEKMLWLMEDYVSKIPNSPKIDPRVIQKIREMTD